MGVTRREARQFIDGRYHWMTLAVAERLLAIVSEEARAHVAANARIWPILPRKLPRDVLAPVVEEALGTEGTLTSLAHLVGIGARRLDAVVNHRETMVGYRVADRIVTLSLGPNRWLQDDLRRWYHAGDELPLGMAPGGSRRPRVRNALTVA
jgi:hypothetical protein